MISVDEARARIVQKAQIGGPETVALTEAAGRILKSPLQARRDQPPFPASAMDGYAVRSCDLKGPATPLRVVGEAAAGRGYREPLSAGEAVRIFTGAPVPAGADAILIQENAVRDGDLLTTESTLAPGTYVRPAGLDFKTGDTLLQAHRYLDSRAISVAAAAGYASVDVVKRPKVAILATGDELVAPGETPGPDQIFASNHIGIAADIRDAGGVPIDLGIAPDNRREIAERITAAQQKGANIIVTLGGASVGAHDFVARSLQDVGIELDFWKIAMRPGKPLMFGHVGETHMLGLPGNPVSGLVCTRLFLRPLIRCMLGQSNAPDPLIEAICESDLAENDSREEYLRAVATTHEGEFGKQSQSGEPCPSRALGEQSQSGHRVTVTAFPRQDSSMLTVFAKANALIVRPPFAPALKAGESCQILLL